MDYYWKLLWDEKLSSEKSVRFPESIDSQILDNLEEPDPDLNYYADLVAQAVEGENKNLIGYRGSTTNYNEE